MHAKHLAGKSDDKRSGEGGSLRSLNTSVFLGHTGREVSKEIRKGKVKIEEKDLCVFPPLFS